MPKTEEGSTSQSPIQEGFIDYKKWAPRLAQSVLRRSLRLRKGEHVTLEVWTRALPWVDAFLVEARRIGAHPMVIYDSDNAYWSTIEQGRAKSLGEIGVQEWAALKETNVYVYFWGPSDRTRFHSLSKKDMEAVLAYEKEWFQLAKEKGFRWCRIELSRVTPELATEYDVDYKTWTRELLEASLVSPQDMFRKGKSLATRLAKGNSLLIAHKNGTRLELRLKGREPRVDDGIVDDDDVRSGYGMINIPAGNVAVAPDENFAEGLFRANRTSIYGPSKGRGEGGTWIFRGGSLVKYNYDKGTKDFERGYLKEPPDQREHPAVFSIGLNPKIHMAPLFEDQELGTVSLFVGSNEWLGGTIQGDYNSWLFLTGADVTVDGDPLLKDGKIVVPARD